MLIRVGAVVELCLHTALTCLQVVLDSMPPSSLADYRRRTICHAFAERRCKRPQSCQFSHFLIDPVKLRWFVGEVEVYQGSENIPDDRPLLSLEFTWKRGVDDGGNWRVELHDGGPIRLAQNNVVRPSYPIFASSPYLLQALWTLEKRIYSLPGGVPWV